MTSDALGSLRIPDEFRRAVTFLVTLVEICLRLYSASGALVIAIFAMITASDVACETFGRILLRILAALAGSAVAVNIEVGRLICQAVWNHEFIANVSAWSLECVGHFGADFVEFVLCPICCDQVVIITKIANLRLCKSPWGISQRMIFGRPDWLSPVLVINDPIWWLWIGV